MVFTYTTLTVVLLLAITCGVAFVFYWLAERSHRFDVNIMNNQDKLLRDSLELNQSLLREINSSKESKVNYTIDNNAFLNRPRPYTDELPQTTPNTGD